MNCELNLSTKLERKMFKALTFTEVDRQVADAVNLSFLHF